MLILLLKSIFALFRLFILFGSIASVFYFLILSGAQLTINPTTPILPEIGKILVVCVLLNTLFMLGNAKTFKHAGPLDLLAPFYPFEINNPKITFMAKMNTAMLWTWILTFIFNIPIHPFVAGGYILTTFFAMHHAAIGLKSLKETKN